MESNDKLKDKFKKVSYSTITVSQNKDYNFITEWKNKVRVFKFHDKVHAESIFAYKFDKNKPFFYVAYEPGYSGEVQEFACISSDYKSFFELISSVGADYDIESFEYFLIHSQTNQIIDNSTISPIYMIEVNGIDEYYLHNILSGEYDKENIKIYQKFVPAPKKEKTLFTQKEEKELNKNISIQIDNDIFKNITQKEMVEILSQKGYVPEFGKIRFKNVDKIVYSLRNSENNKSFKINKILYDSAMKMQQKDKPKQTPVIENNVLSKSKAPEVNKQKTIAIAKAKAKALRLESESRLRIKNK